MSKPAFTPGPWEVIGPYVRSPRPVGALVAVCASSVDSAAVESGAMMTANALADKRPFKGCDEVRQTVAAAKWLGKWVHMGRVNMPSRVQLAEEMGCDSIDGTGIAKYTHMRRAIARTLPLETTPCP